MPLLQPNIDAANEMSDHEVQANEAASVVSQNLQGPYAIKPNADGEWGFDLPEWKQVDESDATVKWLTPYTGMSEKDVRLLLKAMVEDNALKNAKSKNNNVNNFFKTAKISGVGDKLGEFGKRFSIESHEAYEKRMTDQIRYLKDSIENGADVLCIQEQFYSLQKDSQRQAIFSKVMHLHNYTQKATLIKRDVGIWVKDDGNANLYTAVTNPDLITKVQMDIFRGCLLEKNDGKERIIYANLHGDTRNTDMDTYVNDLCQFKNELEQYAATKDAKLVICGDLNLHHLKSHQINKLTAAGFTVKNVKNQKKNYEAFVFQDAPKKKLQKTPDKPKEAAAADPAAATGEEKNTGDTKDETPAALVSKKTSPSKTLPPFKANDDSPQPLANQNIDPRLGDYERLCNHYAAWSSLAKGSKEERGKLQLIKNNCQALVQQLNQSQPQTPGVNILLASLNHTQQLLADLETKKPPSRLFCDSHKTNSDPGVLDELKSITQQNTLPTHLSNFVLCTVQTDPKSAFIQGVRTADDSFISEAYISPATNNDQDKLREFVLDQIESFHADSRNEGSTIRFEGNFTKEYLIEAINYCNLRGYSWEIEDALKNKIVQDASGQDKNDLQNLFDQQSNPAQEADWQQWIITQNKIPFSQLLSREELIQCENNLGLNKSSPAQKNTAAKPPAADRTKLIINPNKTPTTAPLSINQVQDLIYKMQSNRLENKAPFDGTSIATDVALQNKLIQCQQSVKIHVSDSWVQNASKHDPAELMRFNNPGYSSTKQQDILQKAGLLAPQKNDINVTEQRALIKFRVISSYVVLLNEPNFPMVSLMTTAAPNLMGSSTKDLDDYTVMRNGVRRLNENAYRTACEEQARLLCDAAHEQGKTKIIMPDFGLGIYLEQLTDVNEKIKARAIMLNAFEKAANHPQKGIEINWVLYSGDKNLNRNLHTSKPHDRNKFKITTGDLHSLMKKHGDDKSVVFVNPGSDRTIGGAFNNTDDPPLEEQITQRTSLALTQSKCFNPNIEKAYEECMLAKKGHEMDDSSTFAQLAQHHTP